MFQLRQPSGFLQKFVGFGRRSATCCHFDGDCSIELIVVTEKDGTKSAFADFANDAISAIRQQCVDFLGGFLCSRRRGFGERITLHDG